MSASHCPKHFTYVHLFNPPYNSMMDIIIILHFTEQKTEAYLIYPW